MKVGGRLHISVLLRCPGMVLLLWPGELARLGETCLSNLVLLENKQDSLVCSSVTMVGLSKSDLKAHLLVS